jgi:hypothetical protein
VLRTRYDWVIQRKVPFQIVGPLCEWDALNNRSHIFASVATAQYTYNVDPYNQSKFLVSQQVIAGTPGYPGKGMGSTLVLASAENPASTGKSALPGINVLEYVNNSRPTISQFEAMYPTIPLDADGLPELPT